MFNFEHIKHENASHIDLKIAAVDSRGRLAPCMEKLSERLSTSVHFLSFFVDFI